MSTARVVMRSIWRKASGKYALTVLGLWVLVSLVSLVWTPHTLLETDGFHAWASPSAAHPLGTDGVGADVLSWLMAGSRTNLAIALLTVAVSGIFGLALVAAMVSRNTVLRSTSVVVVDALISIPTVLIALMLSVPFGASAAVIVAACGFAYGLNLARIVRPAAILAAPIAAPMAAPAPKLPMPPAPPIPEPAMTPATSGGTRLTSMSSATQKTSITPSSSKFSVPVFILA